MKTAEGHPSYRLPRFSLDGDFCENKGTGSATKKIQTFSDKKV